MAPKKRRTPKAEQSSGSEVEASQEPAAAKQPKRAARGAAKAMEAASTSCARDTGERAGGGGQRFFLMKSEPESRIEDGHDVKFSLEDLKAKEGQRSCWDGVRNFRARNIMKSMRLGDQAFFYHSNCKEPGCVGIGEALPRTAAALRALPPSAVEVVREAYPDHTQFDAKSPYYDAKSKAEDPRWMMVDVKYVGDLRRLVTLKEIKAEPVRRPLARMSAHAGQALARMQLVTAARLSVQEVAPAEWDHILALSERPP